MLSDRPLSCLSVLLMYCGQMVRCIKVPLGTKVCLSPGDIVLDGTQLPPQKGAQHSPSFRPMSIVAKLSPISPTAELLLCNSGTCVKLLSSFCVVYCCQDGFTALTLAAKEGFIEICNMLLEHDAYVNLPDRVSLCV